MRVGHATERERMKPWSEIPEGRERDAAVAEFVMRYQWVDVPKDYDGLNSGRTLAPPHHCPDYQWPPKGKIAETFFVPPYTTDVKCEQSVLACVRNTFNQTQLDDFCVLLGRSLLDEKHPFRLPSGMTLEWALVNFRVGMISAAAYEALRASQ